MRIRRKTRLMLRQLWPPWPICRDRPLARVLHQGLTPRFAAAIQEKVGNLLAGGPVRCWGMERSWVDG